MFDVVEGEAETGGDKWLHIFGDWSVCVSVWGTECDWLLKTSEAKAERGGKGFD